jgi:putative transcriptional regulator
MELEPRIREIRENKGLKQKFVAQKTGISQQQLSDYETGKAYPRIDKAYKIAAVLDCKVDDLYIKKETTPNE